MRCVVFAYQEIGYVCLGELLAAGAEIAAVITHDDDPGEEIWFRSVRELAERHGLPVFAPSNVNTTEWIERMRGWDPEFIFSFYYRRLLGRDLLAMARRGALNLHGSLLPRYRGRCPVNWVLIHGERETGVTLHYMEEKADSGDIVAQHVVPIAADDTAADLNRKMSKAAVELVQETYPRLCQGTAPRRPQDPASASYFGGRRPEDGRIDWQKPAAQIYNLIRAVTHPYPGAFTLWRGRRLWIWDARPQPAGATGGKTGALTTLVPWPSIRTTAGELQLRRVRVEGEAESDATDWAVRNGLRTGEELT